MADDDILALGGEQFQLPDAITQELDVEVDIDLYNSALFF